ncbi:hypothetical protein M378DRAFT_167852, partial [Amanita muscaria Koide BX008]
MTLVCFPFVTELIIGSKCVLDNGALGNELVKIERCMRNATLQASCSVRSEVDDELIV